MSTVTLVPLDVYLRTSYRPDCDYLDGDLLERNVGEWDHSRLQALLTRYLTNREKEWGILVLTEQRVQVKPTRFRVPDISVLSATSPVEQNVTHPPLLCIELLSPEDRVAEMQQRIDDYLAFGVRAVWLIHPGTKRAFVYTASSVEEVKDVVLRLEDSDVKVALAEL